MHKRSQARLLQRRIRALIFCNSLQDELRCETVSKVSRVDVLGLLAEPVDVSSVPDVEKGEVLVNSRGEGSFQRVECSFRKA